MSVNIKQNGVLTKISGLYQVISATLSSLSDISISSPSNGQILKYNSTTSKWENKVQDFYLDQTETLSTTDPTIYTFTNANIHSTSDIDIHTNIWGVCPSNVVATEGSCTVTFPKYTSAVSMTCRIYIK